MSNGHVAGLEQESAAQQLASLADWSTSIAVPDSAAVSKITQSAASLVRVCDWAPIARGLSEYKNATAKWLAAALFESAGQAVAASEIFDSFSCPTSRSAEASRLLAQARTLVAADKPLEAIAPLRRAIKLSDSYRFLSVCGKLLRTLHRKGVVPYARKCRLAMLGNATFDFVLPILKTFAFASNIELDLYSGGYNQHMQELLAEGSPLTKFSPDVVILATDWRSLGLPEECEHPDEVIARKLMEFEQLWDAVAARFHAQIIQHNFVVPEVSAYGGLSGRLAGGKARLLRRLNLELAEAASKRSDVAVLDLDEVASILGKRKWDDSRMWIAAKQYPAADAVPMLVRHQVAILRAILGLNSKCLVLDLDNTLWGGVIGEDGLSGIRLGGSAEGEAFVEFQRYVKALRERGIILAVSSKNNERDAKLPFEQHPEMVLRLDDISVFVANWQPKSENLRALARHLNIGLDSMVFVDDNPVERELVRKAIPEIEVPEMPVDPSLFRETLHWELLFEALSLTAEDRERTESYRANRDRETLRQASGSLDDFLSGLQMRIELKPFDELNLPRIVQLINKTNQFNLTTKRMTAEQVLAFCATHGNYTQSMHLYDRFGDNGITGVLMASPVGEAMNIDVWLMSCRVLGRRAEEAMLVSLWNAARAVGFRELRGAYAPTAKNQQVCDLYGRMGFTLFEEADNGTRKYVAELTADRPFPQFLRIEDSTEAR